MQKGMDVEITEMVAHLNGALGPKLVSLLIDAKESCISIHWADGTKIPDDAAKVRLQKAAMVWRLLIKSNVPENEARMWFIGLNPVLEKVPVVALREGCFRDVEDAAKSFAEGCWQM